MATIKYMRPSGNPIEVNDLPEIREYAAANGWTEVTDAEDKPKCKGRPPKVKE